MQVIQIIIFEFLLGYILQAFTLILGLYAFNRRKIEVKKYIAASVIMAVVFYLTRLLPVRFGVHTILNFVVAYLVAIVYIKLPVIPSAKAVLFIILIIMALDLITTFIMTLIFGQSHFVNMMEQETLRCILGLPSSIAGALTITLLYFRSMRIEKVKGY